MTRRGAKIRLLLLSWCVLITAALCVCFEAAQSREIRAANRSITGRVLRGDMRTLATDRPMEVRTVLSGEVLASTPVVDGLYSIEAPDARGARLEIIGEDLAGEYVGDGDFVVSYEIFAEP